MNKPKETSELEFQGQVSHWLNTEISERRGIGLDCATVEKPDTATKKRNDLVIWTSRRNKNAFLTIELKTPSTHITDPELLRDAFQKAKTWRSPYFAIWNMQEAELYRTPEGDEPPSPDTAIQRFGPLRSVKTVEDWLVAEPQKQLKRVACSMLDGAWSTHASGLVKGVPVDAVIFVDRLTGTLESIRDEIYGKLRHEYHSSRKLRNKIHKLAKEQGFFEFVEDLPFAISGQIGYRYIGQTLFYYALRRQHPALDAINLTQEEVIPEALRRYWDNVRRFDYEALFEPSELDALTDLPDNAQHTIRLLANNLAFYDWNALREDVLGAIFEKLIPLKEQILLGQFYTPTKVADTIVAFCVEGDHPLVLDPGCGSGTFLMSAYDRIRSLNNKDHDEILPLIWGFDLSAFAVELALINLFRKDLSSYRNFPRIVAGNFFDKKPGSNVAFPPPKASSTANKIDTPVPHFSAVIGNPPYLRSQNQDDLDPSYKEKLNKITRMAGFDAASKTDLFAFFLYHSIQFVAPGGRLGFVTSASWLTADYGATLQQILLDRFRLVAVISSEAESFFSQVDVNTTIIIAEMREQRGVRPDEYIKFVMLKAKLNHLFTQTSEYWAVVQKFADDVEQAEEDFENDDMRVKLVSATKEWERHQGGWETRLSWSRYLRAPLSYYQVFGDEW